MKLSTEIRSIARFVGEEEALRILAAAGFEAWDFSMFSMATYDYATGKILPGDHPLQGDDYRAFAKRLREVGEECGISCNQSHAPFPTYCPEMMQYLFRSIECTAIAGGKVCVIHPNNLVGVEENAEMYQKLLPFAKECGVKIATENVFRWSRDLDEAIPAACSHHEDFVKYLEWMNDPDFVACLDIGHAELASLSTSACEMIRALGPDRLACLHVHDNDKRHDSHLLPFSMQIDWDPIATALAEIGYRGDITLECGNYPKRFTADRAAECAKDMAEAAMRVRDLQLNRCKKGGVSLRIQSHR